MIGDRSNSHSLSPQARAGFTLCQAMGPPETAHRLCPHRPHSPAGRGHQKPERTLCDGRVPRGGSQGRGFMGGAPSPLGKPLEGKEPQWASEGERFGWEGRGRGGDRNSLCNGLQVTEAPLA